MIPIETVARAMFAETKTIPWEDAHPGARDTYRKLATAGVKALASILADLPCSTDDWDAEYWIAALIARECKADAKLNYSPTKVGDIWK